MRYARGHFIAQLRRGVAGCAVPTPGTICDEVTNSTKKRRADRRERFLNSRHRYATGNSLPRSQSRPPGSVHTFRALFYSVQTFFRKFCRVFVKGGYNRAREQKTTRRLEPAKRGTPIQTGSTLTRNRSSHEPNRNKNYEEPADRKRQAVLE